MRTMDKKKISLIMVNIMFVMALAIVVFPLLLVAKYNYPSADDWSFSSAGYHALQNGEGFWGVVKAAMSTIKSYYVKWEGRFSISLLGALQPGIWGEKYYRIVPWMMIGGIILSEFCLCRGILAKYAKEGRGGVIIPLVVPFLIMQILYTPGIVESFYWYNGAVNYTFMYALSLILLLLFLEVSIEKNRKWAYLWRAIVVGFLAVLIGGGNFSTSLSTLLTLLLLSGYFLWKDRRAFYRTCFVPVLMCISLLICVFAPGNTVRIASNFDGETGSAVGAIIKSLQYSFFDIYHQSMNAKTFLLLLLVLPFFWKAVKNMEFDFQFPGLFTLVTFCLYASQATPNMYVEGWISSGRLKAVLYYSYQLWLAGNTGYWVGWVSRRNGGVAVSLGKFYDRLENYLPIYCCVVGVLLAGIIYRFDLRSLSSYIGYRSWKQGWAQQYGKEWEERLAVLHDDSIKEVTFAPLTVTPEVIMWYTDLQPEDGFVWVNGSCAEYYDKDVIRIVPSEE